MQNDCEGCYTTDRPLSSCYVTAGNTKIYINNGCPCSECLIKMVCEENCDDLTDHIVQIKEEHYNEKRMRRMQQNI